MTGPAHDRIVVGAGLAGLRRGLTALRAGERVMVVERQPAPGGPVRTLRSEGFSCELGPFAFDRTEYNAICADLRQPPPPIELGPSARSGQLYDGVVLRPTPVEGSPRSGRTGAADLVTACRRELGGALRLGRAVTALRPGEPGWQLQLGGEPPAALAAGTASLCLGVAAAARLLAPLDPRLQIPLDQLQRQRRAFVFLGSWQDRHADNAWPGYGVLVEPPRRGLREAIFCSNAFARRAVAGKALVRLETGPELDELDDQALASAAESELRAITGWSGTTLFRRVHRFTEPIRDGAFTECQVRLRELCERLPGLNWQP